VYSSVSVLDNSGGHPNTIHYHLMYTVFSEEENCTSRNYSVSSSGLNNFLAQKIVYSSEWYYCLSDHGHKLAQV
jgi:hypothetical protein